MSDLINFESMRPPQETLLIFDTNSPSSLKFNGRPSLTGRESLQILDLRNWGDDVTHFPERPSLTGRESLQILDVNRLNDDDHCFKIPDRPGTAIRDLRNLDDGCFKFPERPSLSGRESLQILDLQGLRDIGFDFGRESLASSAASTLQRCKSEEDAEMKSYDVVVVDRKCVSEAVDSIIAKPLAKTKEEDDDVFIESLCIEATHLASKMCDGSILEDSFDGSNILDSTPQPDWEISEEFETEKPKLSTEDVFKTLDLLLPAINVVDTENSNKLADIVELNKENLSKLNEENLCIQQEEKGALNHSDANSSGKQQRLSVSRTSSTSNGSKSRDAKEIIQNLSVVLHSENVTPEQKTTWQNLLCNLADIVCPDDEDLSDLKQSISSSSEESCSEGGERRRSAVDIDPETDCPLDLSAKRRTLSQSYCVPSQKMPQPQKLSNNLKAQAETLRTITNGIGRTDAKSAVGSLSKLKPRKMEEHVKKGPLRAIIPVNVMAKKKEVEVRPKSRLSKPEPPTTPRKSLPESISKFKRITTPISDSKLKPMAQSTPDEERKSVTNGLIKRKYSFSRSSSIKGQGADLNKSDVQPDIANNNNTSDGVKRVLSRGRSAGELKPSPCVRQQLKRSFSIGKENHLSALRKPVDRSTPIVEADVAMKPAAAPTKSLLRPFNLMSKLKPNKK